MVLLSHSFAFSQSCLPNGITFTTQEGIDNFQANYPGCTEIEGDVTILGDNITNLYGLSVLTSIGGHLYFGWKDDFIKICTDLKSRLLLPLKKRDRNDGLVSG